VNVLDIGHNYSSHNIFYQDKQIYSIGTRIGGSSVDRNITEKICRRFKKEHNVDLSADRESIASIVRAAETAKKKILMNTKKTNAHVNLALEHESMQLDFRLDRKATLECLGAMKNSINFLGDK